MGKAFVNIALTAEAMQRKDVGRCMRQPILVSVDDAEAVVAHVQFRRQHGAEAPLPLELRGSSHEGKVQWVVCDLLDMLLAWHKRNRTTCDACGLLMQPFQEGHAW